MRNRILAAFWVLLLATGLVVGVSALQNSGAHADEEEQCDFFGVPCSQGGDCSVTFYPCEDFDDGDGDGADAGDTGDEPVDSSDGMDGDGDPGDSGDGTGDTGDEPADSSDGMDGADGTADTGDEPADSSDGGDSTGDVGDGPSDGGDDGDGGDDTGTFREGSLLIPMDTTYQDEGMLKAFGLVYRLLTEGITVHWIVRTGKSAGEADFFASGTDTQTGETIDNHGYRGGPFVVDAAFEERALPIIAAWQEEHVTTVHRADLPFDAEIRRTMTAAPRIAVHVDGHERIAFRYLNAAAVPDSTGQAWPTDRCQQGPNWRCDGWPDVIRTADIAAGALIREDGTPAYCQLTMMHSGTNNDAAVREIRRWLESSPATQAFVECAAVETVENHPDYGGWLTTGGITVGNQPGNGFLLEPDSTFAQYDGPWATTGGAVPAYGLAAGSTFHANDTLLVAGTPTTPGTTCSGSPATWTATPTTARSATWADTSTPPPCPPPGTPASTACASSSTASSSPPAPATKPSPTSRWSSSDPPHPTMASSTTPSNGETSATASPMKPGWPSGSATTRSSSAPPAATDAPDRSSVGITETCAPAPAAPSRCASRPPPPAPTNAKPECSTSSASRPPSRSATPS